MRGEVKAVLDACVLYPTVMREMLLSAAEAGLYQPLWSARILEEWARAAGRAGAEEEARERALIAGLGMRFPRAELSVRDVSLEARLWLPDPGDVHVLARAIEGHADVIVTTNVRDFPRGVLADSGVARADPDGFLLGFYKAEPQVILDGADAILTRVQRDLGEQMTLRQLMRRAHLPRLGKAFERGAGL